ncbi:hypothetical protein TNCT_576341 [Trichonephila clavata]|uniref:Uncharacterized protein n=1 Tax=Trichonephila clavata TaxID=2740835 RepID=A0A8X6KZX9_TRICU|nr:hypothetical protein TNCT_576341 [Trichonephila clavata]
MCGVKSDCPFNELGYWHVTSNLVVDVMYDLLEDPLSSSPSLPLLSPLSTPSKKKIINIRATVKLKLLDIFAKLEKGDPTNVSILHKYRINRLLVQAYVEKYDCRPFTKNKLDLAKDIVSAFPVLKGSDGEGHEQWFSLGVRGAPATGFIADRFKNFRSGNLSVVEKEESAKKSMKNLKNIQALKILLWNSFKSNSG